MLRDIVKRFPWLRHLFADGGYAGDKLRQALRQFGKWTVEIVKRSDAAKGFVVLPRRWVVESPPSKVVGRYQSVAVDALTHR